jgi:mannitol-1-phosphate/altronate dehydrogenase
MSAAWILDVQQYTCKDYRQEMILLNLRRRLNNPEIDDQERQRVEEAIRKLEKEMGII